MQEKKLDTEIPYEIQAKWRKNLFCICCILALIGTITEIVIYLIDSTTKQLFLPHNVYRLRFIYIPSSLNLIVITVTYLCLKAKKLSNKAKNAWSCILILFLCANTQFIHYVYGPLLALPCLAIFVSILFADKRLTLYITLASCASIAASCIVGSTELRKDDPLLVSDMGLAILTMIVSYIGAWLLIKYVRQQIVYILDGSKREKELIEKLQLDNLMGIYNRNRLDSEIDALKDSAEGDNLLLMIDLDDFKIINDTYGHLSGDEVLITLADVIRSSKNGNIVPCRYGGEEIIILLKNFTLNQGYKYATDLLKAFNEQQYSFNPQKALSFSGGIAKLSAGMSRDEWIKAADDNLYEAKTHGKNCIYPTFD